MLTLPTDGTEYRLYVFVYRFKIGKYTCKPAANSVVINRISSCANWSIYFRKYYRVIQWFFLSSAITRNETSHPQKEVDYAVDASSMTTLRAIFSFHEITLTRNAIIA